MDPLENASRWSRWKASGPASAISKVFSVLDANLPDGWRRLTGEDLLPYKSMVKPESGWYARAPAPSNVGVVLSIYSMPSLLLRRFRKSVSRNRIPIATPYGS